MKKRNKKYILVLFALVFTILISSLVNAGCCFNSDNSSTLRFCKEISEQECCSEYQNNVCPGDLYKDESCGNTECIDYGCCVETCTYTQYFQCSPPSIFVLWDTDCEDNSHTGAEGCLKGCCVEIDSNNNPVSCDTVRLKKECIVSWEEAVTTEFYTGISENACNAICQQNILPTGSVSGFVYYYEDGIKKNAQNALVVLGGIKNPEYYINTESNGYYIFEDVPVGQYIITAYYYGYKSVSHIITILQDQETVQNFDLTITTDKGDVTGKVTDTDNNPIENAYVYYSGGGSFTDINGEYLIKDVEAGDIDLTATASGYSSESKLITIEAGELHSGNFKLTPTAVCGDGKKEGIEGCDDGNTTNCDGCKGDCSRVDDDCGDGIPECGEQCDDGNNIDGDGCTSDCKTEAVVEPGWLIGYVTNKDTDTHLNGVLVQVIKDGTVIGSTTTTTEFVLPTPQDGFYDIYGLPQGSYTVKASMTGYYTYTNTIQITSNQGTTHNIELSPIPEECLHDLPSPELNLLNVKGKTNIKITWTQDCIEEFNVNQFKLYRDNVLIKTFNINDNYEYIYEYIDDGSNIGSLAWNTDYEYELKTIADGEESSTTKEINTGNELCKDITDEEFCVKVVNGVFKKEPIMRLKAECNDKNKIITEDCGKTKICRELDDLTYCISPDDCKNLGIDYTFGFIPNILGMYYYDTYEYSNSKVTCEKNLTSGIQRYCYYDYYEEDEPFTTIDKCINCKQDGTCFDYQSEDACKTDNCDYGNCKWFDDYAYAELGKGFCYQENYKGTKYCSLCNSNSEIFKNAFCTTNLCSKLGACISDGDSCTACDTESKCEDYIDKLSCTGSETSDGFDILNIPSGACDSSEGFEYSDDVCELKRCKWFNNECFKDGNDGDESDCEDDETCKLDTTPPATIISSKPSYINSIGKEITFSTNGEYTYYCIDTTKCCPDKLVLNNKVKLPNDDFKLIDKEENHNISFFSIDKHDNTETIKKETIYVDTKAPTIDVTPTVTNSTTSNILSDLIIKVEVNEKSYCTDKLTQGYDTPIGSKITDQEITTATDVSVTYTNLNDGFYRYSIECEDDHENIGENTQWILVDRVKEITVISPSNNAVLKNPVTISLTTPTQNYCMYEDQNNNQKFIGKDRGKGVFNLTTNKFEYKTTVPNLNTGIYNFGVICYKNSRLTEYSDSINLVFIVDESPPTTTAKYETSTGTFELLKNIPYKNPRIKLECQDSPEQGFGCKETKYCYDTLECTPTTTLPPGQTFTITATNDVYLYYYSVDNGNNIEQTKYNYLVIDTTPPELSITIINSYGNEDLPKVTYGRYKVKIESNEPLENITKFEFVVNGKIYNNLISEKRTVSEDKKIWTYDYIRIPSRIDFSNLQGSNSEFIIRAKDLSENIADSSNIIHGRYFEIDTKGPNPVSLVPDIPTEYYTRDSSIYITGFTEAGIQVVMNIGDTEITTSSAPSSSVLDSATIYDPNNKIDKDKTSIELWDDKISTFTNEKYIEFNNHMRLHGKRYKITSSNYETQKGVTVIEFTPALEQETTDYEIVKVFNEEVPTGWFDFTAQLNYGENPVEIKAIDEIGNIGVKTTKTITFDSEPFSILSYLPRDGTITSNNKINITVVIKDELSEINTDSINLIINDNSYTYNDLTHYTKDRTLFLTYEPTEDWPDNTYTVSISGEDILGNYKYLSWTFTINQDVPSDPQFKVKNGNYYSPYDLWYINNQNPELEVEFDSNVILTEITLVTDPSINVRCTPTSVFNKFDCSFDSPLPEAKHKIEFKASKFEGGSEGRWIKEFIVDITPPVLTFTNLHSVNNPQVTIHGTYQDLSMDTDSIITIKGDILEEVNATITDNKFSASITLNDIIEKDYTIKTEAYDRASNYGSKTDKIKLDLTAGAISVTDVTSTDGTGKIIKINPDQYKTNIDKTDGITVNGTTEEDLILNIYQNGYLLIDISPLYTSHNKFLFPLALVNGLNNIIITGTDIAGNPVTDNETIVIELDKQGPIITITVG